MKKNYNQENSNTATILYLIAFFVIIIVVYSLNNLRDKNNLPNAIRDTSIVISDSGNVIVDEFLSIDRPVDMIICSRGIQSPNPIYILDFKINGQKISKDEIQIKSLRENGMNICYLKLKKSLLNYVNSTDKEVDVRWVYRYNILSKYQSSIFKNIESYNLEMPEIFTPAEQSWALSENINVKLLPNNYYLLSNIFPEYSLTYNSPNSLSLKRKYINTNLKLLGAIKRYFIIRKRFPDFISEFHRQIDLKELDRLEEEWDIFQQSDSLYKGGSFHFTLPASFTPTIPEMSVTIDGKNYKPFPIDSTKFEQILSSGLTENNYCYYYIGIDKDSYRSKVKNKTIDIIYGSYKDQIIDFKIKLSFNPLNTGRLQKVDYFNYRFCYYPTYLSNFNREDVLRINLPNEMTISKIWSYNNHIVDSSSTSLSFSRMNNQNYANQPLIIDIERDGVQTATWLKNINTALCFISLPFTFWWYIKRFFNEKIELRMKDILKLFTSLVGFEISFYLWKSELLELALFTNYLILLVMCLFAILLFRWSIKIPPTISTKNYKI